MLAIDPIIHSAVWMGQCVAGIDTSDCVVYVGLPSLLYYVWVCQCLTCLHLCEIEVDKAAATATTSVLQMSGNRPINI